MCIPQADTTEKLLQIFELAKLCDLIDYAKLCNLADVNPLCLRARWACRGRP